MHKHAKRRHGGALASRQYHSSPDLGCYDLIISKMSGVVGISAYYSGSRLTIAIRRHQEECRGKPGSERDPSLPSCQSIWRQKETERTNT